MTVFGWDLSHYDWARHPVDLSDAKKAGISFVTHKATEGTTYRDSQLPAFITQAVEVGMPVVGTYHAMHPGNVQAQADFWIAYVQKCYPLYHKHPCFIWQIDAERFAGKPSPKDVIALADAIVAKVGCLSSQVVIYGPKWLYGNALKNAKGKYHLWASDYSGKGNPVENFQSAYPGDTGIGWQSYSGQVPLIWQYGSRNIIGAQHTCDANAIRTAHTTEQLQALFVPPVVDPLEEILSTYYKDRADFEAAMAAIVQQQNDSQFNRIRTMTGNAIRAVVTRKAHGWFDHKTAPEVVTAQVKK